MMRLFINALAASAGGGLTYIRNVLPRFSEVSNLNVTVALSSDVRQQLDHLTNVDFIELDVPTARRLWYEQIALPRVIRRCCADILLSTGNFAVFRSPVPQILLSRNSIYLSADFYRDLRSRHEYRTWLDTRLRSVLAKRSIQSADLTIAPSEWFAHQLTLWSRRNVLAIHHGFDHDSFLKRCSSFSPDVEERLNNTRESLRLLFVSHYNYYRNFETLLRALQYLRHQFPRPVTLILTCRLSNGEHPGSYHSESAASLAAKLGVTDMILELGPIPYDQLSRLYALADLYVTPAYVETFAHPLVEAMASGVPVLASDIPVHREICSSAAVYFPKFSAEALAKKVEQVISSPESAKAMKAAGLARSRQFSWRTHVSQIVEECRRLVGTEARIKNSAS